MDRKSARPSPAILVAAAFAVWVCLLAVTARAPSGSSEAMRGRLETLRAFRERIEAARAASGAYPESGAAKSAKAAEAGGNGWVVLYPQEAEPENPAPGPQDAKDAVDRIRDAKPLTKDAAGGSVILYKSDGRDFKLIAHVTGRDECLAVRDEEPGLTDLARIRFEQGVVRGPKWKVTDPHESDVARTLLGKTLRNTAGAEFPIWGTCWAYGYWTPGAIFW